MSAEHKLRTSILISVGGAGEVEFVATLIYARHKGFAGDRTDPPEADSVELIDVLVRSSGRLDPWKLGPAALIDALNDQLQEEMLQHWADDAEAAAEYRAEMRRDVAA